jgi:hypothetical protein
MSGVLKGNRYNPPSFRCPANLLHSAVQWERLRASYFHLRGESRQYETCNTLIRSYENRIRDEAELPKQLS